MCAEMRDDMEYYEFVDEMAEKIKMCFGKEVAVEVHKVIKNNSLEYDSLTIMETGKSITPNFYLQNMYQKYIDGTGIDSLVSEVVRIYEDSQRQNTYENLSMEYEDCIEKIVMRLISLNKNKKLLEDMPYIRFLDMAVVFYCLVSNDEDGIASIRITNEVAKEWQTDTRELYTLALKNSERIFEEKIMPMSEVIGMFDVQLQEMGLKKPALKRECLYEPYVVTNNMGINGASVILYQDIFKRLAEKIGGDFYILPSSIHEVLAMSAKAGLTKEELKNMVKEVNDKCLLPDEYLSDSVYRYNKTFNSLEIVA